MSGRKIVHVEIPTGDRATSGKFYKELFGWDYQIMDEPMPYATWSGDGIGGGYLPLGDDIKPGNVLIYIDSADIDADLKKAESLGAKIALPARAVGDFGWMGMFVDPTGNRICLWKNKDG
jgi:hypothetical protein